MRRTAPHTLMRAYETTHRTGSFRAWAGTQLLATSSVEKGPEISDTGAPAISEEKEGERHSYELGSTPQHGGPQVPPSAQHAGVPKAGMPRCREEGLGQRAFRDPGPHSEGSTCPGLQRPRGGGRGPCRSAGTATACSALQETTLGPHCCASS